MDFSLVKDIGQVVVSLSFIWWMTKRNADDIEAEAGKISACEKDIAVLKNIAANVSADHDKLILVEAASKAAHTRLDDMKG